MNKAKYVLDSRINMGYVPQGGKDDMKAAMSANKGMDMSDETGSGDKRMGQLAANDLTYILPNDMSVTVNNTHKNQFFQANSYTNQQRAFCILNSGADYGDMRNSSLEFSLTVTVTGGADDTTRSRAIARFGENGSVLNIIRSLTIHSRSGDEICRINNLNFLKAQTLPFMYDKTWFQTVGQSMGYGSFTHTNYGTSGNALLGIPPGAVTDANELWAKGAYVTQHFSIPLYVLSDFFAYGRLMPSMILSGMRIEIEFENPDIAFELRSGIDGSVLSGVSVSGYTIGNPYIALRSVQLTDGVQRELNNMSAVNGLELVYCDYERTDRAQSNSSGTNTTFTEEVRKAASRALRATAGMYMVDHITGTNARNFDSFQTEPWAYRRWQWQLGSLYFPQQPVSLTTNVRDIIPESYKHTLIAFNTYKASNLRTSACSLYTNEELPRLQSSRSLSFAVNQQIDEDAREAYTSPFTTNAKDQYFEEARQLSGTIDIAATTGAVTGTATDLQAAGIVVGDVIRLSTVIPGQEYLVTTAPTGATTGMVLSPAPSSLVDDALFRLVRRSYVKVDRGVESFDRGTYANGNSVIACQLERSDLFNLSGVPINNSRILQLRIEAAGSTVETGTGYNAAVGTAHGSERRLIMYLKYVRLARVFLTNVEVEQ